MTYPPQAEPEHLCVLKFGSSVLRVEDDYPAAALEIYRHVRDGEKVVAVVSALGGETDALLDQAVRVGGAAPPALVARLARVGELRSAALMALALSRVGVQACTMDPHEMGLTARGAPLDANLVGLDADAVLARLDACDVVVVPGFTAGHADHGVVTLGRGGTDLSAVFFAARLDAHRVRLIKDVDGVYAEDPARNPGAQRYSRMSYDEAARASAGLIQPKAIHAAETEDVLIEVAAIGQDGATTIAHLPGRRSRPLPARRLRVALLGCGAVGAGVLALLQARADLFDLGPVLVRDPSRHQGSALFTDRLGTALTGDPDIVVELIGGADYAGGIMRDALMGGASVVTANKGAVASHWDALHAAAAAGGGTLRFSAAVGGGAPVLEALGRRRGEVVAVDGVMNGTANFLLGKLGEGRAFDNALAQAQALGFAEADPTADIDGHDAADKLSILVREAFGAALPPGAIPKQSLRDIASADAREALARGEVLKQVGRCRRASDGTVSASVRIESLPARHPLARPRDEENAFLISLADGAAHGVFGKGAGRWPSAASVFSDIMDVQRMLMAAAPVAGAAAPMPLRMSA
ncbi:MAG: Homoserine dehydrogenase [uncultured Sphingomonadaceae bacterium]|uniref:Homoserine dehydrogenase n=1 Tax=uncultured Sphingomonadaceae bacterium TaxID=169976 RepID=A0A6J4TKE9_9SPHN|nr:MAG: Homoserine dehydrogenase [uncultured Sphingomonadaceae bacterium]